MERERYLKEVEPELRAQVKIMDKQIETLLKSADKETGKMNHEDEMEFKDLIKAKSSLENQMSAPDFFVEDYTIESLGQVLDRNGEQVAAVSVEAAKPIQNLKGMYKDGNCEDTIYNKAYSVEPGKVNRVSREANEFHEPCMSILWLTQPDKIPMIFEEEGLVKGGLAPPFITLHESVEIQEIEWSTKAINAGLLAEFADLWNELFDAYRLGGECDLAEGEDEEDAENIPWKVNWVFKPVGTTPEVGQVMVNHYNALVKRRNSELQDIQQFAARWTENAWRLALVFHAVKNGRGAWQEYIELETCEAALQVMEWFANAQMDLLSRGRDEKLDAEVDKLYEIVREKGGRLTAGVLKNNHYFEAAELKQLVERSKGRLRIEQLRKSFAVVAV